MAAICARIGMAAPGDPTSSSVTTPPQTPAIHIATAIGQYRPKFLSYQAFDASRQIQFAIVAPNVAPRQRFDGRRCRLDDCTQR
jgi:hypothetical protein